MELDDRLSQLHSRIDADYAAKIARLETEREETHASLDRLWPFLSTLQGDLALASLAQAAQPPSQLPLETPTPNGASERKRHPFALRRAVREIINNLSDEEEISQPDLYDRLLSSYPALKEQEPPNFRAQIASVLNRLAYQEGLITVARAGRGNNPHVYRKLNDREKFARTVAGNGEGVGEKD